MSIVRLDFESIADRDEVLEHFSDAADKVASQEPGVPCFRASIDLEDPLKVLLVERCAAVLCNLRNGHGTLSVCAGLRRYPRLCRHASISPSSCNCSAFPDFCHVISPVNHGGAQLHGSPTDNL